LRDPDGTIHNIDDPDASSATTPRSINDNGVIAGWFKGADGLSHGFVRK